MAEQDAICVDAEPKLDAVPGRPTIVYAHRTGRGKKNWETFLFLFSLCQAQFTESNGENSLLHYIAFPCECFASNKNQISTFFALLYPTMCALHALVWRAYVAACWMEESDSLLYVQCTTLSHILMLDYIKPTPLSLTLSPMLAFVFSSTIKQPTPI